MTATADNHIRQTAAALRAAVTKPPPKPATTTPKPPKPKATQPVIAPPDQPTTQSSQHEPKTQEHLPTGQPHPNKAKAQRERGTTDPQRGSKTDQISPSARFRGEQIDRSRVALDRAQRALLRMSTKDLAGILRRHAARHDVAAAFPDEVLAGIVIAQVTNALSPSAGEPARQAVFRMLQEPWTLVTQADVLQRRLGSQSGRDAADAAAQAGQLAGDVAERVASAMIRVEQARRLGQKSVTVDVVAEPEPAGMLAPKRVAHILAPNVTDSPALEPASIEPRGRSSAPSDALDWLD